MLGIICIVSIQRTIQKILIAVFLTREYKHDETNRAWWTGKWYGRGLGTSAMSQPAREFVVKIVEMSLWSSDFLLAHILLIMLTPPTLIPFFGRIHSTMLCELEPISLMKQGLTCNSLVTTVKADPSAPVLHQAEEAAEMDGMFASAVE